MSRAVIDSGAPASGRTRTILPVGLPRPLARDNPELRAVAECVRREIFDQVEPHH